MHRLIVKIQPRDVRSFILTDDTMRDLGGVTSGVQSNNSDPGLFGVCLCLGSDNNRLCTDFRHK